MLRRICIAGLSAVGCLLVSPALPQQQQLQPFEDRVQAWIAGGSLYEVINTAEGFVANPPPNYPIPDRVSELMRLVELLAYEAQYLARLPREKTDKRAAELYSEAIGLTPVEHRHEVESIYAFYLNCTNQPGLAQRHFREVIRDPHVPTGIEWSSLGQIATNYMDAGLYAYAEEAIARARKLETEVDEPNRSILQLKLMPIEMSLAVSQGQNNRVSDLWGTSLKLLSSGRVPRVNRAQAAAAQLYFLKLVGNTNAARDAENIIRDNASAVLENLPLGLQLDQNTRKALGASLAECMIVFSEDPEVASARKDYQAASEACWALPNAEAMMRGQLQLPRARTLEERGEYAQALNVYADIIDSAEVARGSFAVGQRTQFFGGRWQAPYHGIVRINARAFERSAGLRSFTATLAGIERTRARQFGDLQGEKADPDIEKKISDYMNAMPENTAVIVFSSQPKELVAVGFTKTARRVAVSARSDRDLNSEINQLRGLLQDTDSDPEQIRRLMDDLSKATLGSVRELLGQVDEVIVIADGPLTRIPFVLFTNVDGAEPVGLRSRVSHRLSLRSLWTANSESSGVGLLAAGSPRYPDTPPVIALDDGLAFEARRVSTYQGTQRLDPLPFARRELTKLATSFDPDISIPASPSSPIDVTRPDLSLLVGEPATEAAVTRRLSGARYIHLASHGLLAGDFGLLEPAIVLGEGEDQDGFLTASEVQALGIHAELTVLSACSSGDGRVVSGEGALSLARSFLIAGSRHVLVSLWPVNDAATSEWMAAFYAHLREGASHPEAVRLATVELRGDYDQPKYWAPFVLISRG